MSAENIAAFLEAVEENESLRDTIDSAMMAAVVDVAAEQGFDFTLEEYVEASSELGEHELDAVAGGVGSEPTPIYRGALSRLNLLLERRMFEQPFKPVP